MIKSMAKSIIVIAALTFQSMSRADLVADGKKYFTESQCVTCHSLTSKKEPTHAGPALYGVTKRPGRSKDWLIKWISDPETTLKSDPLAKKLLAENNNVPMTAMLKLLNRKADGNPDTDAIKKKAEALVSFLKDNDSKPEGGAAGASKKKKD